MSSRVCWAQPGSPARADEMPQEQSARQAATQASSQRAARAQAARQSPSQRAAAVLRKAWARPARAQAARQLLELPLAARPELRAPAHSVAQDPLTENERPSIRAAGA